MCGKFMEKHSFESVSSKKELKSEVAEIFSLVVLIQSWGQLGLLSVFVHNMEHDGTLTACMEAFASLVTLSVALWPIYCAFRWGCFATHSECSCKKHQMCMTAWLKLMWTWNWSLKTGTGLELFHFCKRKVVHVLCPDVFGCFLNVSAVLLYEASLLCRGCSLL